MNKGLVIGLGSVCLVVVFAGIFLGVGMYVNQQEEQKVSEENQKVLEKGLSPQEFLEMQEEFEKQKAGEEIRREQNEAAIQMFEDLDQARKERMEATQYQNSLSPPKPPPEVSYPKLFDGSLHLDNPEYGSLFEKQETFEEYMERIKTTLDEVKTYNQNSLIFQEALEEQLKNIKTKELEFTEKLKPKISVQKQDVQITIYDSKGNSYYWIIPVSSFEEQLDRGTNYPIITLEMSDGSLVEVGDFTQYVGTSFTEVIDDVWNNSANEEDFLYEIWYITSKQTVYSEDIGEFPRVALDTLVRGGGDCEDMSILMADMIKSSSHTHRWNVDLVYFDSDNPQNPKTVNHVALAVDTGNNHYLIETTAQNEYGLDQWADQQVSGWWFPV